MTTLELACRTALAIVMGVAALGKLHAPRELVAPMQAMGLPRAIANPIGATLIALAELAATIALVIAPIAGYMLALGLLVAFTAGLVRAIGQRTTAACRCFGSSTKAIGASHLVRNAVLIAIAVTGMVTHGPGEPPWLAILPGALASLAIVAWEEVAYAFAPVSPRPRTRR